jgi:hypothetical protein
MIEFKKCPILHTHLNDGALQGTFTMVKDNNLYWLESFQTVKVPLEIFTNIFTGKQMNFKKGWYNEKLEYVGEITQEDQDYITEWVAVPF